MNNLALDDATLTLVREYQTLEYLRVIVVTLFFYDYLACLKREINNIWGGKWTALNVLYILTRYIPFFNFIDMFMTFFLDQQSRFCLPLFLFGMWTSSIGIVMAEVCFCLRAYALWGTSRSAAIFLGILFATMIVVGCVVDGYVSASATMLQPMIDAPHLIPHCIVTFDGETMAICGWIIVMTLDTILIIMIVYAKSRMYRCANTERNVLFNYIYRDAVYYFLFNFLISVVAVLFYFIAPGPLKSASSSFGTTMFSILSCKVMLRLRDFGNSSFLNQDVSVLDSDMALSSLRFDPGRSIVPLSIPEDCVV